MPQNYYQHLLLKGSSSAQAANIAQHFAARMENGPGIVINESPSGLVTALRKAWQKLIQDVRSQRDITINVDEKLRLTHRLIKMQSLRIGSTAHHQLQVVPPADNGNANRPKTIYITGNDTSATLGMLLDSTNGCLVVGTLPNRVIKRLELVPKSHLDKQAESAWQTVIGFLDAHNISLKELIKPSDNRMAVINYAMEKLLDETLARQFIAMTNDFHFAARQAMPLYWSRTKVQEQQTVAILAGQIATYTPGLSSLSLADNEDPLFFLSDKNKINSSSFWDVLRNESALASYGPDRLIPYAAGLIG